MCCNSSWQQPLRVGRFLKKFLGAYLATSSVQIKFLENNLQSRHFENFPPNQQPFCCLFPADKHKTKTFSLQSSHFRERILQAFCLDGHALRPLIQSPHHSANTRRGTYNIKAPSHANIYPVK